MWYSRADVIQALVDLYEHPRYLEIGVAEGETFKAVTAAQKVAVDPYLRIDVSERDSIDSRATYHELSSDVYFGEASARQEFDVIFLDGEHTFEQTLRDLNNALLMLAPQGVIVIDDVRPSSELAATADRRKFDALYRLCDDESGAWMGDVYRLVFFIDSFWQQLSYRTVEENHGQLIAWRETRKSVTPRSVEAIARMSYGDMLLSLRDLYITPLTAIIEEVRAAYGFGGVS